MSNPYECSVYKCDTSTKHKWYFADIYKEKVYQVVCGFHYADWKERNAKLDKIRSNNKR